MCLPVHFRVILYALDNNQFIRATRFVVGVTDSISSKKRDVANLKYLCHTAYSYSRYKLALNSYYISCPIKCIFLLLETQWSQMWWKRSQQARTLWWKVTFFPYSQPSSKFKYICIGIYVFKHKTLSYRPIMTSRYSDFYIKQFLLIPDRNSQYTSTFLPFSNTYFLRCLRYLHEHTKNMTFLENTLPKVLFASIPQPTAR